MPDLGRAEYVHAAKQTGRPRTKRIVMSPLSNLATRDVETLVHPYVNLARFRETGPLIIERGKGVYRLRHQRQALYRRHGGLVVHGARLRQRGIGRDRGRADAQAFVRASVHRQEPRSGDRACRETQGDRAGADLEGILLQFRIGGERHPDQARLVPQQCARPAAQEEDRQPGQGLSRRHHRRGLADRAARQPSRLRSALAGISARRLSTSLPLRASTARAKSNSRRGSPTSSTR